MEELNEVCVNVTFVMLDKLVLNVFEQIGKLQFVGCSKHIAYAALLDLLYRCDSRV